MTVRVRLLGPRPVSRGAGPAARAAARRATTTSSCSSIPRSTPRVRAPTLRTCWCPVDELGAELVAVDRGGDVTFHGPGQVVCYPIVSVDEHPGAGRAHVGALSTRCARSSPRRSRGRSTRAWAASRASPACGSPLAGQRPAKVAAVGVRTTRLADGRRRTLHGIALNVDVDLGGSRGSCRAASTTTRSRHCARSARRCTSTRSPTGSPQPSFGGSAPPTPVDRAAVDGGAVAQGEAPDRRPTPPPRRRRHGRAPRRFASASPSGSGSRPRWATSSSRSSS